MARRDGDARADRRARYTQQVIRDAMLDLLGRKRFDRITVTELCKQSEINRGTFYLHYYDTRDVLDDLIDEMLADTSSMMEHVFCPQRKQCSYPLCEKIQGNPRFQPLFFDDVASARVLERITGECAEGFITHLMQNSCLTYEQAEAVFHFQINGCLTVNRMMLKNRCADWRQIQRVIDDYIRAGLTSLTSAAGSAR